MFIKFYVLFFKNVNLIYNVKLNKICYKENLNIIILRIKMFI